MKKERSVTLDSILQVKTLESLLTTEQVGAITCVPVTDALVSDIDDHLGRVQSNKSCTTTWEVTLKDSQEKLIQHWCWPVLKWVKVSAVSSSSGR